jgi:ABC-type dipeptide/oligopeptide/nickel transport system permease subunit
MPLSGRKKTDALVSLALQSQLGEEIRFRDRLRRLARENKTAVFSAALILVMALAAVFAPLLTPYTYDEMDLANRLAPPSSGHLLGTDEGGRDVFTRLLYGARVSLLIGIVPTLLSMAIGAALGIVAGFAGGKTDTVIMRIADVMLAFPSILLAMVLMYMLGDGLINVFLTLSIVNWASVARVVRAETLRLKELEYVEAARVIGVSRNRILLRHILPNCIAPVLVQFTLSIAVTILTISGLSFLGLGVSPPTPEWGSLLSSSRSYMREHTYLTIFPGLAIMVTILSLNLLGDGLRDALDPKSSSKE